MDLQPTSSIKCHKCRHDLQVAGEAVTCAHTGACEEADSLIFLREERLPAWIRNKVEEERWTRGKLHCPRCGGRVGSFDFVSGRRCACGAGVLPAVQLVRSHVDTAVPLSVTRDSLSSSANLVP